MFDVAVLVSDAVRDIERRDGPFMESGPVAFNASFILGGQINGEPLRLFRIYAEGNFIEAGDGHAVSADRRGQVRKADHRSGDPPATTLADATKCILVSFDSTMRSNLSVGMPIDLVCYERDSLEVRMRRRFERGDAYFTALSACGGRAYARCSGSCPISNGQWASNDHHAFAGPANRVGTGFRPAPFSAPAAAAGLARECRGWCRSRATSRSSGSTSHSRAPAR